MIRERNHQHLFYKGLVAFSLPPPSQLELRFRNQFRYYIGNIFMPSLMLVILCYVTLFFDLNDFNVSGLSIRSLAVGMLRTLATVLATMAIGSVETVVVRK